jgi:hypothetical protein
LLTGKIIRSVVNAKLIGGDFDNRQGAAIRFIYMVVYICKTDFESVLFVASSMASRRSKNNELNLKQFWLKKVKI